MEYDFRTAYDSNPPSYSRPPTATSSGPMYAQPPSLYPKIGGVGGSSVVGRNPPFHPAPTPPPQQQSTSGTGIRIAIKPEYRITPPPPLLSNSGEIPRSHFSFDFEFERNVIAEMSKENPNWTRFGGIDNYLPRATESHSSSSFSRGPTPDPIVNKYIAAGLNREAVPLAVANYGDNPAKVKEFANGFNLLREMGFPSNNVADALLMYDNDTDKALAHFLNNSS